MIEEQFAEGGDVVVKPMVDRSEHVVPLRAGIKAHADLAILEIGLHLCLRHEARAGGRRLDVKPSTGADAGILRGLRVGKQRKETRGRAECPRTKIAIFTL